MRGFFGCLVIVLFSSAARPVTSEGTQVQLAELPNPVSASADDIIVVVEEVRPADAKDFRATSDNPDVKVRAVRWTGSCASCSPGTRRVLPPLAGPTR